MCLCLRLLHFENVNYLKIKKRNHSSKFLFMIVVGVKNLFYLCKVKRFWQK